MHTAEAGRVGQSIGSLVDPRRACGKENGGTDEGFLQSGWGGHGGEACGRKVGSLRSERLGWKL